LIANPPEFEVASVKVNKTDGPSDARPKHVGNRVTMHNVLLGTVILYAYKVQSYQILGGDQKVRLRDGFNWYDIDAEVTAATDDDEIRLMLQSLLADRFGLVVHRTSQLGTGYVMRAITGQTKLKASLPATEASTDVATGCLVSVGADGNHMIGKRATMEQLAKTLVQNFRVPVVDETGLRGTYDFDIFYSPEEQVDSVYPSLASAIHDVLGLRLQREQVPVEMLVIDRLEMPKEN